MLKNVKSGEAGSVVIETILVLGLIIMLVVFLFQLMVVAFNQSAVIIEGNFRVLNEDQGEIVLSKSYDPINVLGINPKGLFTVENRVAWKSRKSSGIVYQTDFMEYLYRKYVSEGAVGEFVKEWWGKVKSVKE